MQRKRPVNTQTKEQLDKRMDNVSNMKWGNDPGGQMLPDTINRPKTGNPGFKSITSSTVMAQIAARVKSGEKIEHDYQWGDDIKKEVQERNQERHDKKNNDSDDYKEFQAWKILKASQKKAKEPAEKLQGMEADSIIIDDPANATSKDDQEVYKFSAHARRMIRAGKISLDDADNLYMKLGRKVLKSDLDGII